MKEQTSAEQKDADTAKRNRLCRAGYIAWRMPDMPSIYSDLMPFSSDARILWEAETAIRNQYRQDLELAASPWRRFGPMCQFMDLSNLSDFEQIKFAMEASTPIGMEEHGQPVIPLVILNPKNPAFTPGPGEKDLQKELEERRREFGHSDAMTDAEFAAAFPDEDEEDEDDDGEE